MLLLFILISLFAMRIHFLDELCEFVGLLPSILSISARKVVSWLDKAQIGSKRRKSAEFSLERSRSTDLGVFRPSERSREVSETRFRPRISRFESIWAVFEGPDL